MEYQSKASYGEKADTSIKSLNCTEPSSSSSSNPYKWAESLQYLLEDLDGIKLFAKFLKQEGQGIKCLNFVFACRGLKKRNPSDQKDSYKLIKVIFKDSRKLSAISDETKQEIWKKLSSNTGVDNTIFDAAQREIEAHITKTTYPHFLRSDLFTQYLRKVKTENLLKKNQDRTLTSETGGSLPTVQEDGELQTSYDKISPHTKSNSVIRYNANVPSSKFESEGPRVILQSPYNNVKYNSSPSASVQDSELQSLSDAQTDESMSVTLTESNVDMFVSCQSKQQKHSQKASKQTILPDKEKSSNGETFLPHTQKSNPDQEPPNPNSPEGPRSLYGLVCKKFNKVIDRKKQSKQQRDDCVKRNLEYVQTPYERAMEYMGKGNKFYNKGRYDKAFECYTNAIEISPSEDHAVWQVLYDKELLVVLTNRALACVNLQNYHTAISDATRAIDIDSNYIKAYYARSKAYAGAGELEKSLEDITRVCKLDGFHSETYLKMADNLLKRLGKISTREVFQQEENDQDILDQHISRVFDDCGSHNPLLDCTAPKKTSTNVTEKSQVSPQYASPYAEPSGSYSTVRKHSQASQFTVPNSIKYQRERDCTSPDSALYDSEYCDKPVDYSKRSKELSKRFAYKKNPAMNGSFSSFFDSGVSVAYESEASYTSSSRKSVGPNSSSQSIGYSQRPTSSSQIVSQDMQMSRYSSTDLTLNEAPRRLQDDNRAKMKSWKPIRKPCSLDVVEAATRNTVCNDGTLIGYSYDHSVPYQSRFPGKNITLRQFKNMLSRKGNFRYFFKTASNDFGTGVVFEEVNDDNKILPLWKDKVFCLIETQNNCVM